MQKVAWYIPHLCMLIHYLIDGLGLRRFITTVASYQAGLSPPSEEQVEEGAKHRGGINTSTRKDCTPFSGQDLNHNTLVAAEVNSSGMTWLLEKFHAFHGM